MNKKFKKGHADLINSVAESASKLADETNKAGKAVKKLGKQLNKTKHHKAIVSASEMTTSTLYKGQSDGKLYRRVINGKIQRMDGSQWKEVKVNYDFLNNEKFREY